MKAWIQYATRGLLAMAACAGAGDAIAAAAYASSGICAGFPRVDLQVPAGWCVAMVADAASGLRFPRRVLEVAPGRYWLVDMGSWEPGHGRLLELELGANSSASSPPPMKVIADKLDRPHGIALGPDGMVYVGEARRIWRTKPTLPIAAETIVEGLPDDGSHPLKELAFGERGQLFFNVGSASDACRDDAGKQPFPCPQVIGAKPRAAVYEATLGGPRFTLQSLRPYATGLRNSLALAYVPSAHALLQGENSIDYPDETQPPEKLDLLRDGVNYGWPYCAGKQQAARGYEGRFDCARTEAPAALWPAHAAPLQMIAVPSTAKNPFAGQVLLAWHGYRAAGHRIVSFSLDASGHPTGPPHDWISGWAAKKNVRPLGAPAGLWVDSRGRLLVVEDRNRTLLMLTRDAP